MKAVGACSSEGKHEGDCVSEKDVLGRVRLKGEGETHERDAFGENRKN